MRGALSLVFALASVASCGRDGSHASGGGSAQGAECGHTSCGSNYFVDATPPADCAVGANCTLGLTLVATGDFHINDDYPYKFRADDAPHVSFQGKDPAGATTFSKVANDWQKLAAQKGAMSIVFQAGQAGTQTLSGVFKLSVCSTQNCQLEQTPVRVAVRVR